MDRWIDLNWTYDGTRPGGFVVAVSGDGYKFKTAEQVGPKTLSASVFVAERPRSCLGFGGKLYLRVAALERSIRPASGFCPGSALKAI